MDEYLIVVDSPLLESVGGNYFYAKKVTSDEGKTHYKVIGGCDDTHLNINGIDYGAINVIIIDEESQEAVGLVKEGKKSLRLGKAKVQEK